MYCDWKEQLEGRLWSQHQGWYKKQTGSLWPYSFLCWQHCGQHLLLQPRVAFERSGAVHELVLYTFPKLTIWYTANISLANTTYYYYMLGLLLHNLGISCKRQQSAPKMCLREKNKTKKKIEEAIPAKHLWWHIQPIILSTVQVFGGIIKGYTLLSKNIKG